MRKILCFLGFHRWIYFLDKKNKRECTNCKRLEGYVFSCEGEGAGNLGVKYYDWKLIK